MKTTLSPSDSFLHMPACLPLQSLYCVPEDKSFNPTHWPGKWGWYCSFSSCQLRTKHRSRDGTQDSQIYSGNARVLCPIVFLIIRGTLVCFLLPTVLSLPASLRMHAEAVSKVNLISSGWRPCLPIPLPGHLFVFMCSTRKHSALLLELVNGDRRGIDEISSVSKSECVRKKIW